MVDCLDYKQTHRYANLFLDYLEQNKTVKPFFNRFPHIKNFEFQIKEKLKNFNHSNRKILVDVLNNQYGKIKTSKLTLNNIDLLQKNNTFTITTGHQLNLFTGPIYTFYKIISVINTCRDLKLSFPKYNFVPIFWLASEDHDFEEINHFNFKNKKLEWTSDKASGAVGELKICSFSKVYNELKTLLPQNDNSAYLLSLFEDSYLKHANLSDATLYLYNELFKDYGLVLLEPNHPKLKSCIKNYIKSEVFDQKMHYNTSKATDQLLENNYHKQVTPRKINLFYKTNNLRERIIYRNDKFYVNNTDISFNKSEIESEIENHPECFSPNALFRPLYQEVLLPNLSYIGGAGELSYWLQLKSSFQSYGVTFPMLQMRNSALLFSKKTHKKLNKLEVDINNLFLSQTELTNQHTKRISKIKIDFSDCKQHLSKQFKSLYELAEKTDKTFLNAVAAQEKKQHNGLDKLEKRLLKAQKRKLDDELKRLTKIQNELFPEGNLQERHSNFFEFYVSYGKELIPKLIKNLNPFDFCFSLIELETIPKTIEKEFFNNSN
jgi:bacillithiol biosynthesis cysteine-adding enzyme BshC